MTLLLYLTSRSMTMSRSIHVAANGIISFSQWLSDGLYVPCLLYRLLCQQTLGFFHVLAIVQFCSDSGVCVSFWIMFFSGCMPRSPPNFYKRKLHLWTPGIPPAHLGHSLNHMVLAVQSCPTLCDPMDCSPPGSCVHGILQAKILEWVAISSSRGSSRPRDGTQESGIAGRVFTIWATREASSIPKPCPSPAQAVTNLPLSFTFTFKGTGCKPLGTTHRTQGGITQPGSRGSREALGKFSVKASWEGRALKIKVSNWDAVQIQVWAERDVFLQPRTPSFACISSEAFLPSGKPHVGENSQAALSRLLVY